MDQWVAVGDAVWQYNRKLGEMRAPDGAMDRMVRDKHSYREPTTLVREPPVLLEIGRKRLTSPYYIRFVAGANTANLLGARHICDGYAREVRE